ncbi:MAG: prepilin-type N-terminal cleavage/methylation domain-containing protein [Polaromonas sp.]|nr:prepilin-type N-terminal cleavage/methylation domain-containing protein [Polaromonas sp.]
MRKVKKQSGFTLVEIAIVLVIIGLLLGGVLKGQELIESTKIKNMAKDLNGFSSMLTSYQDRYRAVPGDDAITATTYTSRGWVGGSASTSTVDNLIGAGGAAVVMFPAPAATSENLLAIQALRQAGFLEGIGSSVNPPSNAAGGAIGFTHTVMAFGAVNVVCYSGLNGKQAGALDRLLDDGVNTTGSVRSDTVALAPAAPSGTTVYSELTTGVTLCKTL